MIARVLREAALEIWTPALTVRDRQLLQAQHVEDRRRHVDMLRQVPHYAALNSTGIAHDQWHAQSRLIAAVLFKTAMLTQTIAVIRHIDDKRILFQAQAAEGVEHAADIPI